MTSHLPSTNVTKIANSVEQSCTFPDQLKLLDVSPVTKMETALQIEYEVIKQILGRL